MRTLIIGAGAIGCYLACKLSDAGADVTVHGLGPAFQRIAEAGVDIAVRDDMRVRRVPVNCALAPPAPAGWDLLVFAVKAQDLPRATHQFAAHAREAIILLPQNGLPYWQFLGNVTRETRLVSVDPEPTSDGELASKRSFTPDIPVRSTPRDPEKLVDPRQNRQSAALTQALMGTYVEQLERA